MTSAVKSTGELGEVINTTKRKKSLAEKVASANSNNSWGVLDELGDSRFQIPERKKPVDVNELEKNIVTTAKSDTVIVKAHEVQQRDNFAKVQKDIAAIQEKAAKVSSSEVAVVEAPVKEQLVEQPVVEVQKVAAAAKIAPEDVKDVPQFMKKAAAKTEKEVLANKNVFFRFLMKGLAQSYVDKTTSLFNPVFFIMKNFNSVFQTSLILGLPAIITWALFTQHAGLKTLLVSASTPTYVFYAVSFYFATLFVCLTIQVIVSSLWTMISRSMSEVAVKASVSEEK